MPRFTARRLPFGRPPGADDEDQGEGLPKPTRIRLAARRAAGIAEAGAILEHLPGPGESVHAVMTCRLDLADVIAALMERLGPCDRLVIATLGYNARNLRTMLGWLDGAAVASLTLLASRFFRSHNGRLWETTLDELHRRGHRAACADSHAKVVTLAFRSGELLSIEGSSNLCGNGSAREQLALIRDDGLHDWHSRWIADLVTRHEGDEGDRTAAG
jgi:hypothetical protein